MSRAASNCCATAMIESPWRERFSSRLRPPRQTSATTATATCCHDTETVPKTWRRPSTSGSIALLRAPNSRMIEAENMIATTSVEMYAVISKSMSLRPTSGLTEMKCVRMPMPAAAMAPATSPTSGGAPAREASTQAA